MKLNARILRITLLTVTAASALAAVSPTVGPPPSGYAPPTAYVGPTENLTQVANAMSLQVYSLSTQVSFSGGLALTMPICITIFYDSYSDRAYSNVLFQTYDATNGNRLLFNDPEGPGMPRQATLRVQLFEPRSGGCGERLGTGFDLPDIRVNLDPLYAVDISALDFTLGDNCDPGASQIGLHWYSPDGKLHTYNFTANGGKTITFPQFAWKHPEVSASTNLHPPTVAFWKIIRGSAAPNLAVSPANLVPAKTRSIRDHQVSRQCRALLEYKITFQLDRLGRVRVPPTGPVDTGGVKP
jgi:hypothetical protein